MPGTMKEKTMMELKVVEWKKESHAKKRNAKNMKRG